MKDCNVGNKSIDGNVPWKFLEGIQKVSWTSKSHVAAWERSPGLRKRAGRPVVPGHPSLC